MNTRIADPLSWCVFLVLYVCLGPIASPAVELAPPYKSRLWQSDENPSRNIVQAVTQTTDGFLWIGTQDGLARFDGERFEFFAVGLTNNPRSQRINVLSADPAGGLWVGTAQGLFYYENGKWISHAIPRGSDATILSFHRDDGLWIGTRIGLLRQKNRKLMPIGKSGSTSPLEKDPAAHSIRGLAKNNRGELWITAGENLYVLTNGVAITNLNFSQFKPGFLRSVCCGRDGSIWAGSHAGLLRFKDGVYSQFTKANGLLDNTVTSVFEDRHGNLWVGTFGGLCRFVAGKFVVETKSEGEPYDSVFCFFEDREGNLWVGAKDGLYQLNIQQFMTISSHHGLTHNNIMSVYEDRERAIWIGTWGGGLNKLHEGKVTVYSTANTPILRNDLIVAIRETRDGSLWFGADYDGGLYRFKDGEIQHFGQPQGVSRSAIRALLEDRNGKLLIGHASGGVGTFEKGKVRFQGIKAGLPSANVRCLLETRDGEIWLGSEAGLVLWTNKTFKTFTTSNGLSDNTILSLYEDSQQDIWIGTASGGVNRLRNQRFTSYTTQQGLPDNNILEIVEDDFGNFWLASRRGIFRVNKKEFDNLDADRSRKLSCSVFAKADGMNSQICVGVAKPSAIKTQDGKLWFATTKGVAVTDPKLHVDKNNVPPPVLIRRVIADKKPVNNPASGSTPGSPGHSGSAINIAPGRGDLEFHYTALSYTVPEKNRFRYKLEGFDRDWVEAGFQRIAFYNNTPPGTYTFRVAGSNNDGVWNEEGAEVTVTLQPHFWQSWWFKFSVLCVGLSLVTGGTRYVTKKRMQRKIERLEQQHVIERERARIAKDIHDDLGASLTRITFLGELAETDRDKPEAVSGYVQRIVAAARDTVRGLDEIVWAVNPKNDTLDSLMEYIAQFVHEFFQNTPIRCRLDLPDEVPSVPLSSEMRHNIFLVVKEALNNALKHSQATSLSVQGTLVGGRFQIEIKDDGRGFDLARNAGHSLGNGLDNMRRRIEESGGSFDLKSAPGQGTRITLSVPVVDSFSANAILPP